MLPFYDGQHSICLLTHSIDLLHGSDPQGWLLVCCQEDQPRSRVGFPTEEKTGTKWLQTLQLKPGGGPSVVLMEGDLELKGGKCTEWPCWCHRSEWEEPGCCRYDSKATFPGRQVCKYAVPFLIKVPRSHFLRPAASFSASPFAKPALLIPKARKSQSLKCQR